MVLSFSKSYTKAITFYVTGECNRKQSERSILTKKVKVDMCMGFDRCTIDKAQEYNTFVSIRKSGYHYAHNL
jgi:ABC-type thiamine transport system substrate-binding protein